MIKVEWKSVHFQCRIFQSGSAKARLTCAQQGPHGVWGQWWLRTGRFLPLQGVRRPWVRCHMDLLTLENVALFLSFFSLSLSLFFPHSFVFSGIEVLYSFPWRSNREMNCSKCCLFLEWTPSSPREWPGIREITDILKRTHLPTEQRSRKHNGCCKQQLGF